jgi:hypothetical protein
MTTPKWARLHEELAGDLEEIYALRRTRDGTWTARRWFCRQLARAVVETHVRRRHIGSRRHGDSVMQTLVQNLRHGMRMLRKQPGFTLTAIVMLALGVGANATVFGWINAVLLDPMPGARTKSCSLLSDHVKPA